ncbi:MAG: hypothetical protein HOQ24_13415 [Mycobacteriaceae bacterium]|nr:hypothetical protein [Mycobacteriaceae bacterium]
MVETSIAAGSFVLSSLQDTWDGAVRLSGAVHGELASVTDHNLGLVQELIRRRGMGDAIWVGRWRGHGGSDTRRWAMVWNGRAFQPALLPGTEEHAFLMLKSQSVEAVA